MDITCKKHAEDEAVKIKIDKALQAQKNELIDWIENNKYHMTRDHHNIGDWVVNVEDIIKSLHQ